jgi:hypothetical protein
VLPPEAATKTNANGSRACRPPSIIRLHHANSGAASSAGSTLRWAPPPSTCRRGAGWSRIPHPGAFAGLPAISAWQPCELNLRLASWRTGLPIVPSRWDPQRRSAGSHPSSRRVRRAPDHACMAAMRVKPAPGLLEDGSAHSALPTPRAQAAAPPSTQVLQGPRRALMRTSLCLLLAGRPRRTRFRVAGQSTGMACKRRHRTRQQGWNAPRLGPRALGLPSRRVWSRQRRLQLSCCSQRYL